MTPPWSSGRTKCSSPFLKSAQAEQGTLAFLDESGYQLAPVVRRTYAPRGQTPILAAWDRHERISAISAITYSLVNRDVDLAFTLLADRQGAKGEDTIRFLDQLLAHVKGPLHLVWDRGNIHERCKAVREFLAAHPRIKTLQFPAYAPDCNPDEGVWGYTKYARMANLAPENASILRYHIHKELTALQQRPDILTSFIAHADLPCLL